MLTGVSTVRGRSFNLGLCANDSENAMNICNFINSAINIILAAKKAHVLLNRLALSFGAYSCKPREPVLVGGV